MKKESIWLAQWGEDCSVYITKDLNRAIEFGESQGYVVSERIGNYVLMQNKDVEWYQMSIMKVDLDTPIEE